MCSCMVLTIGRYDNMWGVVSSTYARLCLVEHVVGSSSGASGLTIRHLGVLMVAACMAEGECCSAWCGSRILAYIQARRGTYIWHRRLIIQSITNYHLFDILY